MPTKRTSSGARNPYQGDAVELAKYRKARDRWEREGRRGPPPLPPKRRSANVAWMKANELYRQTFRDGESIYFYAQSQLKNGGWKGILVRDSGRSASRGPLNHTVDRRSADLWQPANLAALPKRERERFEKAGIYAQESGDMFDEVILDEEQNPMSRRNPRIRFDNDLAELYYDYLSEGDIGDEQVVNEKDGAWANLYRDNQRGVILFGDGQGFVYAYRHRVGPELDKAWAQIAAEVANERTEANPLEPTVRRFIDILGGNIIQYDMRVSASEAKKGRVNIYRLGLLLAAKEKVVNDLHDRLDSSDPQDLKRLRASIQRRFLPDFPPAKKTVKAIDEYLATGKPPKYPTTKAARSSAAAGNPSKYTAEQLAYWKRKHRDMKKGSTIRGDAMVVAMDRSGAAVLMPLEQWSPKENPMSKRTRGRKNPGHHHHHAGCGCPLAAQKKMAAGHGACCDSCARDAARAQNPDQRKLARRLAQGG